MASTSTATKTTVKATTSDGKELAFNAADLRFSLGQAVDEATFKQRYAAQGIQAPNVITLHDLNKLRLQHRLKKLADARKGANQQQAAAAAPVRASKTTP